MFTLASSHTNQFAALEALARHGISARIALGDTPAAESMLNKSLIGNDWGGAGIDFQKTANPDNRVPPIFALEFHEFERRCAIDEESTASAALLLDHPVSPAVSSNQEYRRR